MTYYAAIVYMIGKKRYDLAFEIETNDRMEAIKFAEKNWENKITSNKTPILINLSVY